jgi:3-phosphoshikimate 1-carboxyvinyltransferase
MTLETLRQCGVEVDRGPLGENEYRWAVKPGPIKAFNITVEPDLSNAAAFVAAAMATRGQVGIPDWPTSTHQAGDQLRVLLAQMGAQVQRDGNDMVFRGTGEIRGLDADLHDVGELTPVIAALCALASTPSSLRGIAHLRGHETDRLAALATEINRLGGKVVETQDGLKITPAPLHGGVFETYEDHRMAMAGVVIALAVPGVQIENIETTSKTMPDFAQMWLDMIGHNA